MNKVKKTDAWAITIMLAIAFGLILYYGVIKPTFFPEQKQTNSYN